MEASRAFLQDFLRDGAENPSIGVWWGPVPARA
jgi:hypothetical protein